MLSKKEKETLALEKYLKASGQSYEVKDFESPDFILNGDGRIIGCEVTEFYPDYTSNGSKLRKREGYLNKLHQSLRFKLLEQYPVGYSFSISYDPLSLSRSSIELEVLSVFEKIQNHIGSSKVKNPSINIRRILINKIGDYPSLISLKISSDYEEPQAEWFQSIIKSKSDRSKNWDGDYEQRWLLISIGLSRSGDVTIKRIKNLKNLNLNNWDKVILIDVNFSDYVEINAT